MKACDRMKMIGDLSLEIIFNRAPANQYTIVMLFEYNNTVSVDMQSMTPIFDFSSQVVLSDILLVFFFLHFSIFFHCIKCFLLKNTNKIFLIICKPRHVLVFWKKKNTTKKVKKLLRANCY